MQDTHLFIEKMVAMGFGLGRLGNGKVILVRHVLPGETVLIKTVSIHKDHDEAKVTGIVTPSPHRVRPRCELFGRCGGCDFQHIAADTQLQLKQEILRDTLTRTGNLAPEVVAAAMTAPLSSPRPFNYRQRIRLHTDGNGRLGFYRYHTHQIAPLEHCPLARVEINEVLAQLQELAATRDLLRTSESLELLLNPDPGSVILLLHGNARPRPNHLTLGRIIEAKLDSVAAVLWSVPGIGLLNSGNQRAEGDAQYRLQQTMSLSMDAAPRLLMAWEPGGFSQVNREQNEALIRLVSAWVGNSRQNDVLDLYCGMGNFAVPIALQATTVLGLDSQGAAIRSARRNAGQAKLTHCGFEKTPVADGVARLVRDKRIFGTILLDPPRQGGVDIMPLLSRLKASRIIYISCDAATLARDLVWLRQAGYVIVAIQPIDMFPQTHHLETAVLLQR